MKNKFKVDATALIAILAIVLVATLFFPENKETIYNYAIKQFDTNKVYNIEAPEYENVDLVHVDDDTYKFVGIFKLDGVEKELEIIVEELDDRRLYTVMEVGD